MDQAAAVPIPRRLSTLDQFFVSCLWLAYNVQWGALLFLVLPQQIALIVGPQKKEMALGIVLPIGAVVSMLVTPLAGALSDRCRSKSGKRRPFLIAGVAIDIVFLLLMSRFGAGSNVALFALCFMGVQFGCNWWGGPYAGLVPDVVPTAQIGQASGWQALMTSAGLIVGAVSGGLLTTKTSFTPAYLLMAGALAVGLALTLWGVREPPAEIVPEPFDLAQFARSFVPDVRKQRNFVWVMVTRALINMGVYSVSPLFLYLLTDVIGVGTTAQGGNTLHLFSLAIHTDNPGSFATMILMAIIIGMGVPTGILAGYLSDRHGRKPWVYAAGAIMSGACLIYVGVTSFPNPSLQLTFLVAGLYGIGNGAYTAVDWALALDVLPSGMDAAKDMGVWHVAIVLPQVVAPAIAGSTVSALKHHSLLLAYTVLFGMSAMWFVLGTLFVKQIRDVR